MAVFTLEMYGVFRRLASAHEVTLELETETSSVQALLDVLAERYPDMQSTLDKTACAINDELVTRDVTISPAQRLALIPPVSGG